MRVINTLSIILSSVLLISSCEIDAPTPDKRPDSKDKEEEKDPVKDDPSPSPTEYKIFLGNTHAHSQLSGDATQTSNEPSDHYRLAKTAGYDFYAVTDHSQYDLSEEGVAESVLTGRWNSILTQADQYTDDKFVALRGYEYSENDGPGAKGHLNVFNSNTYLNALAKGIDMKYFHDWICAPGNEDVLVCMNHPADNQYDSFACYNEKVRSHICLIELINSGNCNDHYPGYLAALAKGWKVSPAAGSDLHNTNKVATWPARTGIAAAELTRKGIFEAMKARRTFATYDASLKVMYYVNDKPMGTDFSTRPAKLDFKVTASSEKNTIKRIDICTQSGKVVKSSEFNDKKVEWTVSVDSSTYPYLFVNVYGTGTTALAYAAPVWFPAK